MIRLFASRVVGSTPTRFRHIFMGRWKLEKNEAAKGGGNRFESSFVHKSLAARVTTGLRGPFQKQIED